MSQSGAGKSPKRIHGSIGYYGLEQWWLTELSDRERDRIESVFQPLGSSDLLTTGRISSGSLTTGDINYSTQTAVGLLSSLAGWFQKPDDRAIARKILKKALEMAANAPVLDVHFLLQQAIQTFYKDRDNPDSLEAAVNACKKAIELAPKAAKAFKSAYRTSPLPSHKGFEQLAIILEKQGAYQEAIDVSLQAQSEGWAGSWQGRVERCEKKLKKSPEK